MANVIELGQIKITEDTILKWMAKYEKKGADHYCKQCGSLIQQTTCYVSVHLKAFEPSHDGPGKVIHVNYPYCPKCDGEIDYATACFHIGREVQTLIKSDSAAC